MNRFLLTLSFIVILFTASAQRGGFDMTEMVLREKETVLAKVSDLTEDQKLLVNGIYDEFGITIEETVEEIRKSHDYSQFRTKIPALREEKDLLLKDVFNEAQYKEYKEVTTSNGLGFGGGRRNQDTVEKQEIDSTRVAQ